MLEISTDIDKLDVVMIYKFLCYESYWAKNRTLDQVNETIKNSLCFGLFLDDKQIGFARLVTDYAIFGYLCDVFIIKEYRSKGYAQILMDNIMSHHVVKKLRKLLLVTSSAHTLYDKFGFSQLSAPDDFMEKFVSTN